MRDCDLLPCNYDPRRSRFVYLFFFGGGGDKLSYATVMHYLYIGVCAEMFINILLLLLLLYVNICIEAYTYIHVCCVWGGVYLCACTNVSGIQRTHSSAARTNSI